MQVKSLIFFVSSIAISWAADVSDALNDISAIKTQASTLDDAIQAFPNTGGSLVAALNIHTLAANLQSTVDSATSTVDNIPTVTESDGQNVLTAVQGLVPVILSTLNDIVDKKPAFMALPIGGIPALVLQDLENLDTSTSSFENALIGKAPNDLKSQGGAIASTVTAAFADAIAAYSS